jgi:hypothetical protein
VSAWAFTAISDTKENVQRKVWLQPVINVLRSHSSGEKMHRIRKLLVVGGAALLASVSMAAKAGIIVDFSYRFVAAGSSGSFSAEDINHDNLITLNEVTAFSEEYFFRDAPLASLNGFGTYDIASNVWSPDAPSGYPQWSAWFAWNANGVQSFVGPEPSYAFDMQTEIVRNDDNPQDVPEPGTLALLGLGAFGLSALRRRRV